jgi:hypothetical protein
MSTISTSARKLSFSATERSFLHLATLYAFLWDASKAMPHIDACFENVHFCSLSYFENNHGIY